MTTYCTTCLGQGGRSIPQTWDEPADFVTCPACLDKGLCPKCGQHGWQDDEIDDKPCRHCGWNWGKLSTDLNWTEFARRDQENWEAEMDIYRAGEDYRASLTSEKEGTT